MIVGVFTVLGNMELPCLYLEALKPQVAVRDRRCSIRRTFFKIWNEGLKAGAGASILGYAFFGNGCNAS